jgi:hypothetical protein
VACGLVAYSLIASYEYASLRAMDTQDEPTERIVRTTITLPESLSEGIRTLAEKHDRPLSWEIRRALEAHLAHEAAA